jgi:hypothetical protein
MSGFREKRTSIASMAFLGHGDLSTSGLLALLATGLGRGNSLDLLLSYLAFKSQG